MITLNGPLHFEIYLSLTILYFVSLACFKKTDPRFVRRSALVASALGIVIAAGNLSTNGIFFYNSFQTDFYSQFLKLILTIGFLVVVLMSQSLEKVGVPAEETSEYYLFLFSSLLGMSLLVSSVNFLLFYVSLELTSYSLYLLVPMRRHIPENQEASLKYFLFGALASGMMLFGLSYLYGAFGSLDFYQVFSAQSLTGNSPLLFLGILLAVSSLFYKLAIVPFHYWAPDVYQETPPSLTAFIATLSKLAGIAVLLRFFYFSEGRWLPLNTLLILLSVVTMTWGNLAAIRQRDAKRMLAYSSISQVGYLLLGVLAWGKYGYGSVIYYSVVYMVMTLGAFFVVTRLAREGKDPGLEEFQGLSKRSPFLAFIFLLSVFSLAGIPPLAGFSGKWILFKSALDSGFPFLVVWAMINSTISLYYYLIFVKEAYLREPPEGASALPLLIYERALGLLMVAAIIFLGIYPTPLYRLAERAVSSLF